jgi:hypothetical protein
MPDSRTNSPAVHQAYSKYIKKNLCRHIAALVHRMSYTKMPLLHQTKLSKITFAVGRRPTSGRNPPGSQNNPAAARLTEPRKPLGNPSKTAVSEVVPGLLTIQLSVAQPRPASQWETASILPSQNRVKGRFPCFSGNAGVAKKCSHAPRARVPRA